MNIYIKKSRYITKQGKSALLFDCFSGKYRKKINTNIYVPSDNYNELENLIKESEPKHISLNIALKKLEEKKNTALQSYKQEKWTNQELENFLKSGIELYSLDEYVLYQFGQNKSTVTRKDYINVIKVFKKHLYKQNKIQFEEILDSQALLTFKMNALINGLKQSSINSYVKKLKVIMNNAYRDGYINERFVIPTSIIEEVVPEKKEMITYKEIEEGIAKIENITEAQAIALFLLMLSCKGMYPADVMNYKKINKAEPDKLLIKSIFEKDSEYFKYKKSKKSDKYKYVRINHGIKKLIALLKITFHITHYKKHSDILAPYNDPYHVFEIDINNNNNAYKNLWNFYQKLIKSTLNYSFTAARDSFNIILEEQEMTNQTRDILTGNISDKELTQTSSLKLMEAKEKMRDIEDEINREFRIIDLAEILINKIKLIGYDIEDIKLEKWDTPKAFIQSINKFNYI